MENWREVFKYATMRYMDHSAENFFNDHPYTAMTSFAVDDALALSVSKRTSPPTMRLWVHDKTIVLGIPDTKLPYIEEGIGFLKEQGYRSVVRNSGGLAVALDDGVLNLSLILPDTRNISIHECYQAMVHFVRYMLRDLTDEIRAYEIVGSYCPGEYDLSINGKKFAGISQRRIRDGAAVQIYLDINGNSRQRAHIIRTFYSLGIQDAATKFTYPKVIPEVMSSLSELLHTELTVEEMKARVWRTLDGICDELLELAFSHDETAEFEKRYKQMIKRNKEIAAMQ